jgi:hypothetical protein
MLDWPQWLLVGIQRLRLEFRKWKSRDWPSATASIQRYAVEAGNAGLSHFPSQYQYRSVFGYVFNASRPRCVGFFVLEAEDEDDATNLQKQAEGLTLTVRYNPENPDVSLVTDESLLGRKIIQNPHWLPSW